MNEKIKDGEAQKIFGDFLTSKKLRLTSQRKIIFNDIISRKTHTNIDELFLAAKEKDPNIGLATMYRTVKLLTDSGLVREVSSHSGKPFYEAVVGRSHHDHLTCDICGENIEFAEDTIEKLQDKIAEKYGYTLTGHSLYLRGICPKCRKKAGKKR